MFSTADIQQATIKSHLKDPSSILIGSLVKNNTTRIRNRIETMSRAVPPEHLIVQLLIAIGYRDDWTYEDVAWRCRRKLVELGNSFGITSPGNYGKVHVGEFIEGQQEFIVLNALPIDPKARWQDLQPARYMYHDYTNLNWEFGAPNGSRGFSFIEINLTALAWQYCQGMKWYTQSNIATNKQVFAYKHVIYRMLPTYMDLALFNRSRFLALGVEIDPDPANREYPIPMLEPPVTRNAKAINTFLTTGDPLPGVVLNTIPLFFNGEGSALRLIVDENRGQTTQHKWVYRLVNFSLMRMVTLYDNPSMQKFYPTLLHELRAFEQYRILDKLPDSTKQLLNLTVILPLYDTVTP